MPNTLFLYLEAPLQSWGERAQWSERDTAPEPTKSGIVGLLACALGWADDAHIRELSQSIRVGVRCDRIGRPMILMDYHTVGGGYTTPQLLTGEGKPKFSKGAPHTEPTKRYYLSDAAFLVAIQALSERIQQLAAAVQSPVWPMFLGRKSCVPTRPPYDGEGDYDSLEHALQTHPARTLHPQPANNLLRAVIECSADEEGSLRRRDVILKPSLRLFGTRYSREVWLKSVQHASLFAADMSSEQTAISAA
jgi:CRISPR system Cascade subunit CasD